MGTVMGKTQACAISTVAWFVGERRVPQIAARVEQVSECITMWRGFHVTQGAESVRSGGKRLPFWQMTPRRWNRYRPNLCHCLLGVRAGWKPSTPGFWQAPDPSVTLDGAFFNKEFVDSFSREMEMQTWKRAAGQSLSAGMEKGIITDFAKKGRSQLIRKISRLRVHWTFLFVEPSTNFTCLRMVLFPINFSVYVATRGPWPPGSTNCGNVPATA